MAWAYRKPLTINSALTPGALTDFPILISIASDSDLSSKAQADGDDIAFFDSDEVTQLDHEIESYSSGTLVAHVKKPSLAATGNPIIYMYYGDAEIGPQEDPANVWTSSYVAVYHMGENPGGTAPQILDSSSNAYHATASAGMTSGNSVSAKIGNGVDFGGPSVDEYLTSSNSIVSTLDASNTWQISFWMRATNATTQMFIMGHGNPYNIDGEGFLLGYRGDLANDPLRFYINNNLGSELWVTANAGDLSNKMYYIIFQITRNGNAEFFKDGTSIGATSIASKSGGTIVSAEGFILGDRGQAAPGTTAYDGILDEVRISTGLRNTDWITAEYNNQNSPDTFITVGSEESLASSSGASASFYYRMHL